MAGWRGNAPRTGQIRMASGLSQGLKLWSNARNVRSRMQAGVAPGPRQLTKNPTPHKANGIYPDNPGRRRRGRDKMPGRPAGLAIRERSDNVKLNRLTLTNFKGIRSFTLEPQGEDVNIYGDNAVGKTTIFDAFTWLLFGKDSLNRADFEIKTLGLMVNRSTVWSTR